MTYSETPSTRSTCKVKSSYGVDYTYICMYTCMKSKMVQYLVFIPGTTVLQ